MCVCAYVYNYCTCIHKLCVCCVCVLLGYMRDCILTDLTVGGRGGGGRDVYSGLLFAVFEKSYRFTVCCPFWSIGLLSCKH